ncbi:MAG: Peptidase superfamily [Chloroflexota bacterium]|nr:Peptidase superfamily [Chloroflexota bacterium]
MPCDPAASLLRFCEAFPSFAPASSTPLPLVDQIQPCDGSGFRPAFCVAFPSGGPSVDRPTLVARRQDACAELGGEAPDFCLILPSDATSTGVLRREVALALLRQRLGSDFRRTGSGRAQLWTELGVSAPVSDQVFSLVSDDAAAVEAFFGRSFREPPAVFLFRSRQSFGTAIERQFGVPPNVAGQMAQQLLGLLLTGADAVAINGEAVLTGGRPIVYRHELGHVLIHQLAGDDLPAWLDEGLATYLSDFDGSVVGPERAVALSVLRVNPDARRIFAEGQGFLQVNTDFAGHAYAVAAEAVHLLDIHGGRAGVVALLEAIGRGVALPDAFPDTAGETLDDFLAELPARAWGPCRHGVLISAAAPDGLLSYRLYGFAPQRQVRVRLDGPYGYAFVVTPDRFGVYSGTFGPPMPAGSYRLSALADDGSVMTDVSIGDPASTSIQRCE